MEYCHGQPVEPGIIDLFYTYSVNDYMVTPEMLKVLNEEELQIYQQFLHKMRRYEFAMGRYLLKTVLAGYLKIAPVQIRFQKNEYGKIYLDQSIFSKEFNELKFNITHSRGIIACGVALGAEIGIDAEKTDRKIVDISLSFFAPPEIRHIQNQPEKLQNKEALWLWTLKEAYIKAKGYGLGIALDSFCVLENPEFFLATFEPKPDYYLSLAVENKKRIDFKTRITEVTVSRLGNVSIS